MDVASARISSVKWYLTCSLFFSCWLALGSGCRSAVVIAKETASRGALLLDISGVIVDKPDSSQRFSKLSRQLLGASSDRLQENSLFDIVNTIRQAKDDRNITGIVMDLKNFAGGDQPFNAVHRQSSERVS